MKSLALHDLMKIALLAALTAIGAFLKVPVGFSSFTLQFFFTCMAGILLGPYKGACSQLVYVLLGLFGVPIFTEGGGFMYFAKPTFGFLLGLIPAAFFIGLLSRRLSVKKPVLRLTLACLVGLAALYAVGLPYMYLSLGGVWSLWRTVCYGCLIFLPFDGLKIVCAALLGRRVLETLEK